MNWSGMVVFSCSSAVHLCIHPTIAIYRSGINSATWLCCGCSSTHRWLTTVQPPTGTTFRKLFPQQEWLVSIHCFIDSPPFTPRRCITWAWREEQKFSWGPPGCCVLYGTYHHIYIYPPIKARKWHMDIQGIMNKAWELQVPGHQTLLSMSEGRRWVCAVVRREENQGEEQEHHHHRDEEKEERWRRKRWQHQWQPQEDDCRRQQHQRHSFVHRCPRP